MDKNMENQVRDYVGGFEDGRDNYVVLKSLYNSGTGYLTWTSTFDC